MADGRLAGKVCLVTGATRGIGKGIAVQLALNGAKVYITGRTLDTPKGSVGGSLKDTAKEIASKGGVCIPVQCDHSKESDIEKLFDQVKRENDGQLDVLVNNAYAAVHAIFTQMGVKFWDQPPDTWDVVNNVGLRNHYFCSVYAARMMVPRKSGLIVNISSAGGLRYLFNVPYGVGKEACDRMAADCGHELRKENVAFISLWPGPVGTENVLSLLQDRVTNPDQSDVGGVPKEYSDTKKRLAAFAEGETPEFAGKCIAAMAADPEIMKKTGKIVMTADLAREYGLQDEPGHKPLDMRQINNSLRMSGHTYLAWFIPDFIRLPKFLFALAGNKFY